MNVKGGVAGVQWWIAMVVALVFLLTGLVGTVRGQRDPGINQPGVVGNRGRDPGVNQPGMAGNVGRDPGINQPGVAGNRGYGLGGSARQTRALADPGINQPGVVGNRRR